MSNANLGWFFYKDYFRDINWNNIDEKAISQKVDNIIIKSSITKMDDEPLGNIHFRATTTYPGLLLGSGYLHKLPSIEGQAILGFDFDYTTGLPIIRGSSIKGVLRSAFKHTEYIKDILSNQDIDIKALENEIFENNDIFFDATIISGGKILTDDYLAPHGDNPLKNPTPLRFIKIAPNVTFRFDFLLNDGIISKEDKAVLFGEILYDLGVGAKTNVGYGKFIIEDIKAKIQKEKQKTNIQNATNSTEKAIAIIQNAKKPTENLFKNLKNMEKIDSDKEKVLNSYKEKFPNQKGKWNDKIIKLLQTS